MIRPLGLVLLLTVGASLAADDNLLGLPTPNDPTRPGAVMLHGGGRMGGAEFDRFWELAGGKQARIVLVPSAGYRPSDYDSDDEFREMLASRFSSWVALETRGWAKSVAFLYTDDPDDAESEDFVEPLLTATGVWFCGGAQSRLNYRYVNHPEPTKFQVALRGVLERGGVVGGTSAGMAALPQVITLYEDRAWSSGPAYAVCAHGLGLFDRAIVEQHFDGRGGRLERFTSLLRDNDRLDRLAGRDHAGERMMGIAVEERTALVVQGNRMEVLGAASAHVFVKASAGRSITWHELTSGETAQFRRDLPGYVVVGREELMLQRE
jgi:cyanophycinase